MEEIRRAMEAYSSWSNAVYDKLQQEARQKGIHFPDPQLVRIMEEIKKDSRQIYEEMKSEIVNPVWDVINEYLEGPTATYIKQLISWFKSANTEIRQAYKSSIKKFIQMWRREFRGITETIIQGKLCNHRILVIIMTFIIDISIIHNEVVVLI